MFKFNSLVLVLVCTISNVVLSGIYSGGDGTVETPYKISNSNDLIELWSTEADWNKNFIMTGSVDLTGIAPNRIGYSSSHSFNGIFDGNNFVISNVDINLPGTSEVGLFGYVGYTGIVKNVHLDIVNIKANNYVGGIAGRSEGVIQNCHVSGSIEGQQNCGGITGRSSRIGFIPSSGILNCSFRGQVTGTYCTGGIVGETDSPVIANCYAIVEIIGVNQCGGIVGRDMGGHFSSCFAKGTVTCQDAQAGGFAGICTGGCGRSTDIQNCYADVIVNCSNYAGGFSGSSPYFNGTGIRNCYCSGKVIYDLNSYEDIGGFIGENDTTPSGVYNCYFLETCGPDNGFGEPLSEKLIAQQNSFTSWDFVEVWQIGLGQYPSLRTYIAPDVNFDRVVNLGDFAIFAEYWLKEY